MQYTFASHVLRLSDNDHMATRNYRLSARLRYFKHSARTKTSLHIRKAGFWLAPLLFLLTLLSAPPEGMEATTWHTAGLAIWMILWWVTEALPLSATALLPAIILPLLNVMDLREALTPFANPIIFLFLGGFIIALAIEKCRLHLRIALNIMRFIGTRPDRMVGGFMAAAAFLSMWISNTATMLMLLPVSLSAVAILTEKMGGEKSPEAKRFGVAMLLGLAYASSVGGIGTIIGTPPNAILSGYLSNNYGYELSFVQWMSVGVPVAVLMTFLMWWVMVKWLCPVGKTLGASASDSLLRDELAKLGPMRREEKTVAGIALATALLWTFRPLVNEILPFELNDTIIALIGALALFAAPVNWKKQQFVLNWSDTDKLPWGVLILFGGGLSLASGFEVSGLAQWIGGYFTRMPDMPLFLWFTLTIIMVQVTTSLMSNVASINIFLPILAPAAVAMNINPLFLAIPAAMSASCAFMLPVSTANNAIAYGTGRVSIREMVRIGFWLNLMSIPVLMIVGYTVMMLAFDIEPGVVPAWAMPQ